MEYFLTNTYLICRRYILPILLWISISEYIQCILANYLEFDIPKIALHPNLIRTIFGFVTGLCNLIRHSNFCDTFHHQSLYQVFDLQPKEQGPTYICLQNIEE